MFKQLQILIVR